MSNEDKEKPKPPKPEKIHIFVDGQKYDVDTGSLNGAQIKALANADSAYQLFLEQPGDDLAVRDDQAVQLKNGQHFYTVPPATLG